MTQTTNQDVHRFLKGKGFKLLPPRAGAIVSYVGPLPFRGKTVQIRLDILDWDFQSRPEIKILDRPQALSGFRAHLGAGASLCYLDRESVFMDPYDPVSVVGRCLINAESTLEEIAGDSPRVDFKDEFLAQWSATVYYPLLLWKTSQDPKRMLSVLEVDFFRLKGSCHSTTEK